MIRSFSQGLDLTALFIPHFCDGKLFPAVQDWGAEESRVYRSRVARRSDKERSRGGKGGKDDFAAQPRRDRGTHSEGVGFSSSVRATGVSPTGERCKSSRGCGHNGLREPRCSQLLRSRQSPVDSTAKRGGE